MELKLSFCRNVDLASNMTNIQVYDLFASFIFGTKVTQLIFVKEPNDENKYVLQTMKSNVLLSI